MPAAADRTLHAKGRSSSMPPLLNPAVQRLREDDQGDAVPAVADNSLEASAWNFGLDPAVAPVGPTYASIAVAGLTAPANTSLSFTSTKPSTTADGAIAPPATTLWSSASTSAAPVVPLNPTALSFLPLSYSSVVNDHSYAAVAANRTRSTATAGALAATGQAGSQAAGQPANHAQKAVLPANQAPAAVLRTAPPPSGN
ncbi:hypothetical protein HDU96_001433 [Phlyctochytrium bullatum]|nr:hypothetical protein HDU96_001433 [Phlyctochytrium bullatum]